MNNDGTSSEKDTETDMKCIFTVECGKNQHIPLHSIEKNIFSNCCDRATLSLHDKIDSVLFFNNKSGTTSVTLLRPLCKDFFYDEPLKPNILLSNVAPACSRNNKSIKDAIDEMDSPTIRTESCIDTEIFAWGECSVSF